MWIHILGGFSLNVVVARPVPSCRSLACLQGKPYWHFDQILCRVSFRFCFLSLTLLLFHFLAANPLPLVLPPSAHFLWSLDNSLSNEDENAAWQAKLFCVSQVFKRPGRKIKRRGVAGRITAALCLLIFKFFFFHLPVFSEDKWRHSGQGDLLSQPETNLISPLSLLMAAALCYWSVSPLKACLPLALWRLYFYLFPRL